MADRTVRPGGPRFGGLGLVQQPPDCTVEVIRAAEITAAFADQLARLTRLAYTGSDPLPGLPPPDGQFETAAAVLAASREPGWVYTVAVQCRLAGMLRVTPAPGRWRIGRISVLPGYRRRGLTRLLLDNAARDAHQRGVDWLELDAVVERCLAPLYAGLGFRVRSNWPSPDKPLSELTMRRPTGEPAGPVPVGWHHARLSEHVTVCTWLLHGRRLMRISQPASGDPLADALTATAALDRPGLLLAGLDLSREPAGPARRIRVFAGGRTQPEHLMPRSYRPGTLALWRPAPGREVLLAELRGG